VVFVFKRDPGGKTIIICNEGCNVHGSVNITYNVEPSLVLKVSVVVKIYLMRFEHIFSIKKELSLTDQLSK
jgi:hypothetical protein